MATSPHRERLSWKGVLPVEQAEDRTASAPPATPAEAGNPHPAKNQDDPGEHQYENGDTSAWAEDVHRPPYPESGHPATPDEGVSHPAAKAANDLREAMERKANLCIRIAQATLPAGTPVPTIEAKAVSLMDLSDDKIASTLDVLGLIGDNSAPAESTTVAEDTSDSAIQSLFAGDDEDDEDEGGKSAEDRMLQEMLAEANMSDEDRMLQQMLAEQQSPEDAMLQQMLAETETDTAACGDEPMAEGGMDEVDIAMVPEDDMFAMDDMYAEDDLDPMGMLDDGMPEGDDSLAMLYASEDEDGDDEGDDEDDDGKKAGKSAAERTAEAKARKAAAARRPQPKKASTGATRLGTQVNKTAGAAEDDLSNLWDAPPDVSDAFR